jgi:hypothetical protein
MVNEIFLRSKQEKLDRKKTKIAHQLKVMQKTKLATVTYQ